MNKRQLIWLVIRLAGCFFIWRAAENVFAVLRLYLFTDPRLVQQAAGLVLLSTLAAPVYLIAGLYCLAGGEFIHSLLNRRSDKVVVSEQHEAPIDEPASTDGGRRQAADGRSTQRVTQVSTASGSDRLIC